ncbi:uncharacterized protein RAG0_14843 [Rhynchosporium agropyri]|uniref:Uncharacterized protein n=1 Tax=Rhynchosporium agropyri TaxID=914238 RepID=A0A1E1LIK8_9HELO|nr:uncharacterized protein RAG0_14843 [Rhynchosporium agropyri]
MSSSYIHLLLIIVILPNSLLLGGTSRKAFSYSDLVVSKSVVFAWTWHLLNPIIINTKVEARESYLRSISIKKLLALIKSKILSISILSF